MSKHGRRSDQIQSGRGRTLETGMTARPDESAPPADGPAGAGRPADREAVGKYWIVIIVWTIGFGLMVAFEIFAAVFRG